MTNYNERLDEALERLAVAGRGWGVSESVQIESMRSELDEAKQAILDWYNKQVEAVLDRLQVSIDDGKKSHSMAVIRGAIEAERNKLKEQS